MFIGIGEIVGSGTFGIFGKATIKYGRNPVILLGFIVHAVCYFLVSLNLPNDSVFGDTYSAAFITSNVYLALFCSFLLGFGDACYKTQVYSILGDLFRDQSAGAFAILQFVQGVAIAIAFFYAPYVSLYYQLLILIIWAVIGSAAFWVVEREERRTFTLEVTPRNDTNCVAGSETQAKDAPVLTSKQDI